MATTTRKKTRKTISNAARGAYFKARSKKWLQSRGYEVWDMEKVQMIYKPGPDGPELVRAVKQDQLGADLGAMRGRRPKGTPHRNGIVLFVQVKGGETARSGLAAARRAFRQHDFPSGVQRHIHVWIPFSREPEIIDCSDEVYDPCEEKSSRPSQAKTTAF